MAKVKVTKENKTGRNTKFNVEVTRAELVKQIEKGLHPKLHVRKVNGIKTPCSNPNSSKKDNLG